MGLIPNSSLGLTLRDPLPTREGVGGGKADGGPPPFNPSDEDPPMPFNEGTLPPLGKGGREEGGPEELMARGGTPLGNSGNGMRGVIGLEPGVETETECDLGEGG